MCVSSRLPIAQAQNWTDLLTQAGCPGQLGPPNREPCFCNFLQGGAEQSACSLKAPLRKKRKEWSFLKTQTSQYCFHRGQRSECEALSLGRLELCSHRITQAGLAQTAGNNWRTWSRNSRISMHTAHRRPRIAQIVLSTENQAGRVPILISAHCKVWVLSAWTHGWVGRCRVCGSQTVKLKVSGN